MAPVQRRARALVRPLTMPAPWSMAEVCEQVGALRGRPIHLEPSTSIASTAVVRREPTRDVITYRSDHHNPDHLIGHELGHLLAGHLDDRRGLAGSVSSDVTQAVFAMQRACTYDTDEERLAEAVADLLTAAARRHSSGRAASASGTSLIRGFGEAMR